MKSQIQPERSTHSPTEVKETLNFLKSGAAKISRLVFDTLLLFGTCGAVGISILGWKRKLFG